MSGVRSSCESVARNSSFMRLARSASSRPKRSQESSGSRCSSVRFRSWMSMQEPMKPVTSPPSAPMERRDRASIGTGNRSRAAGTRPEGLALRERLAVLAPHAPAVIRMYAVDPAGADLLLHAAPHVLEPGPVEPGAALAPVSDPDEDGRRVGEETESLLAPPDLLHGLLAVGEQPIDLGAELTGGHRLLDVVLDPFAKEPEDELRIRLAASTMMGMLSNCRRCRSDRTNVSPFPWDAMRSLMTRSACSRRICGGPRPH